MRAIPHRLPTFCAHKNAEAHLLSPGLSTICPHSIPGDLMSAHTIAMGRFTPGHLQGVSRRSVAGAGQSQRDVSQRDEIQCVVVEHGQYVSRLSRPDEAMVDGGNLLAGDVA